jgi:acetolactate synthase-1/2/3 large subunit
MEEFDHALKQSLTGTGITIIDVPVDYSRNTELFAQLHDGVLD